MPLQANAQKIKPEQTPGQKLKEITSARQSAMAQGLSSSKAKTITGISGDYYTTSPIQQRSSKSTTFNNVNTFLSQRDSRINTDEYIKDANRYRDEAEYYYQEASNKGDQDEAGYWRSVADEMTARGYNANNTRKQAVSEQIEALKKQGDNLANALRSAPVNASLSMDEMGVPDIESVDGALTKRTTSAGDSATAKLARVRKSQKELEELLASYGDNTNSERDEAIARTQKGSREYRRLAQEQLDGMREELATIDQAISEAGSEEEAQAFRQRKAELNSYMMQWGPEDLATKLYNDDKQFLKDFDEQWNNGERVYTGMDYANKVINSFGERTAGAGANLLALGARAVDYGVGLGENVSAEELAANAYATDPTMVNRAGQEAYTQQWDEATRYNPETGEYGVGNETLAARAAGGLEAIADRLDTQSQKDLQMAKDAAVKKYGWLGGFATDITSTALDIGFDTITGGGLTTMAARVAGSGFGEARRQGATAGQQFAYGASKAAIEVATEKLGDGLAIVYGKGVSGDIVEKAIGKLAKTDRGANFLRLLAGTISEGGEEVISDLLDPFTQWIISEEARNKGYWAQLDPSDILYDFLLGAAMGFGGSAIEAGTGGYQAKNVEQTDAMRRDLDNALPLSQRELDAYNKGEKQLADRLANREENEVRAVLKKAGVKGESLDSAVSELMRTGKSTARDRRDTIIRNAHAEGVGLTDRETTLREEEEMLRNYEDEEAPPERTKGGDAWADNEALREPPKSSRSDTIAQEGETVAEEGEAAVGLKENNTETKEAAQAESAKEFSAQQRRAAKDSKAAIEAGKTDNKKLAAVVKTTDPYISSTKTVKTIRNNIFARKGESDKTSLVDKVARWMDEKIGGRVYTKKLGGENGADVILNKRGIKNDIAHGIGEEKVAAFQAIPDVLRNGQLVSTTKVNGEPSSYIIAGKVNLIGRPTNVYCVVKKDGVGSNRFYLHEVTDGKGNLLYQLNDDGTVKEQSKGAPSALQDPSSIQTPSAEEAPSENSIPQEVEINKAESETAEEKGEGEEPETPATAEEAIEEEPETADEEDVRPEPTGKRKGHKKGFEEKTQSKGAQRHHDSWMTEVGKKYNTDNGTFVSYTRAEVSRIADYCIDKFGLEEEHDRLMNKKDWNRVDFSEAGKIVYQMTVQLNRDMTNGARGLGPILERMVGETYEEYRARQAEADKEAYKDRREPIDALLQAYAEQKSEAGQRLQEEHKFSTADDIRMRASQRFLNYSYDGEVVNATEYSKSAKMWRIMDDLLTRAEAAETAGNKGDLVELTRMVSRIRSRDNMFGKAGVKAEKFLFDRMLKGGLDSEKLAALAYGNISKIMDDLTPITYADAIESVRMNNMLSNFATGINNLVNNAAALRTQAIAQNAAIPFAKQFEKITGKKVAVRDTSWRRSKAIVRAEEIAYEYAVLSAYYGINAEDGRIDTKRGGGAGFSLTGTGASGMVGRTLARYSFFVNSLVLSPDAPAKARARLGLQQGIEEAFKGADMSDPAVIKNMKELEAFANNEALRRTLQDDNKYTNFVKSVKTKLLGDIKTPGENIEIKGRKLGSFDLGSFMIAFAKVPTNVGIQKVAATPYGALYQVARYANGLIKAKANPESMTATEMAKLSRDVGRACTTVGMIGLGAIGAMTGALKNFDDTDDEEEKKLAAEKGYKGLTFNLSAIFHGGEWRDGDTVISGNFLEILATPLAIGAIMYDAMQEGASLPRAIHYGTVESFTQIVDAVTEIPGLQQVGQLYESFVNRDPNENDIKGMLKAVGQFAVNTGTSYFVPNLVSQTTAGVDNKQRDIYTTNGYAETLRNIVMSKTPGLRQMLPEKTDTFGNTRTYGDSPIMAVINTVLLPGDIRKYHVSDLEKELLRLNQAGYKSTWFDTKGPKNISVGDNEYGLTADERRAYHMTKARYLVEAYDEFRTSDEYKNLDDAQKAAVYKALRLDAERMTKNECLEAAGIEARATMDKWETEFDSWSGKINYLTAKQQALASWDTDENTVSDYAGMDAFIKNDYGKLDKKTKDLLNNSLSHLDDLYEASKVGISSENWQKCYDIYREYNATDEEGHKVYKANMTNSSEMWARMQQETGLNDKQMRHIEDNMELRTMISPDTEQYYEYLDDAGLTRDEAKVTIRKMSELQPATGYTSVQNSQKYLVIVDTVPKAKQWDAFWTIVPSNASKNKVKTLREDQRKGVSLATALQHVGWNIVKTK